MPLDLSCFSGQSFYVVGLGLSGLSAAGALRDAGACVWVWDDRHLPAEWSQAAVTPDALDYSRLHALILSPGIPLTHPRPHPVVGRAKAAGVPILSDVALAFRAGLRARALGITGTNGKSTTTALVHHALEALGQRAILGGNFGVPLLDLDDPGPNAFAVLELSSYQLDLSPDGYPLAAACLLNISADHWERHGGLEGYAAAKAQIFKRADRKIVTGNDPASRKIAAQASACLLGPEDWAAFPETRALRGVHNQQNQAAACALLESLGFARQDIVPALESFPGLAHRQEIVGQTARWLFVNDSKATNVDSTARALRAFDDIHWLAGGRGKAGGFAGLTSALSKVCQAYLYGENCTELATFCQNQGLNPQTHETLDQAVAAALHAPGKTLPGETLPGGTLLLSPAAASWDQYPSFEARGEHFRRLVQPHLDLMEAKRS